MAIENEPPFEAGYHQSIPIREPQKRAFAEVNRHGKQKFEGIIIGAPAYNAAGVIVRDMKANLWWKAPELEKIWSNLPVNFPA